MSKDQEIVDLKTEIELHKKTISEWQDVATKHFENSEKLQAFKDYVHNRLDGMHIEKDPEGEHKEHGCRIGGRLDIIEYDILRADKPYSLYHLLEKLIEGNNILLHEKSYDGHGWELLSHCVDEAEELLTKFNKNINESI